MHWFEECEIGSVQHFGRYDVTDDEIIEFATRYDPQPFHLSEEGGGVNPVFGQLCASGWHTGSMAMRMLVDEMRLRERFSIGSPGLEELKWLKPVLPGDTLSMSVKALSKSEPKSKPDVGFIRYAMAVYNQKGEEVIGYIRTIMVPRASAVQESLGNIAVP